MIIAILSGKGGTGKTTVAVNLALSLDENVQLLDCDVEEPNAHLFIKPVIEATTPVAVKIPRVDPSRCVYCGRCQEVCAFNALALVKQKVLVFPELCHSCGACVWFCPRHAIEEIEKEVGSVTCGGRGALQFVAGCLDVGRAIPVPVIKAVKQHLNPTRTVLIDAPPGTSCPVIEAVKGCDYCLIVTEPTPFGFNDFQLIEGLLKKMDLPYGVVINRCDLGDRVTDNYCEKEHIPVLARIPFSQDIAAACSRGEIACEKIPQAKEIFQRLAQEITGHKKS